MSQPDLTADTLDSRLDDVETRVLGCLMEKAVLTPRHYPLTMNGLRNACNQKTGRDPVVSWHEHLLHGAVDRLAQRGLVRIVRGGRALKIEHVAEDALRLGPDGIALLSVLMLRGPLSSADLMEAAGRLHRFDSAFAFKETLERLLEHEPEPLAAALPVTHEAEPQRFRHCLSDSDIPPAPLRERAADAAPPAGANWPGELEWIHGELTGIRDLLDPDDSE